MPETTPKIQPPKPGSSGNGQGKRQPDRPSPWVREKYIQKVKEISKKTPPPSKKPS